MSLGVQLRSSLYLFVAFSLVSTFLGFAASVEHLKGYKPDDGVFWAQIVFALLSWMCVLVVAAIICGDSGLEGVPVGEQERVSREQADRSREYIRLLRERMS